MAEITVRDNGPYVVKGGVILVDAQGAVVESSDPLFLCRCGESEKKPLCDGTHKRVGFASVIRASAPVAEA